MVLEGVVRNGVIVPDVETELPEGARVRISLAIDQLAIDQLATDQLATDQEAKPFGERFAQFKGAISGLPQDLAKQHEHYRLGTPKR